MINTHRLDHIYQDPHTEDRLLFLHYGDVTDSTLADSSCSRRSSPTRCTTSRRRATSRSASRCPSTPPKSPASAPSGCSRPSARYGGAGCAFYQASSSELFGSSPPPQNEDTPFHPRSPYGVAKVYRATGPRSTTARPTACSRSTASSSTTRARAAARPSSRARSRRAVARIAQGKQEQALPRQPRRRARLGFRRRLRRGDVAHAAGRHARRLRDRHRRGTHGARVLRAAFRHVGLDWEKYVEVDQRYHRPAEVDFLLGDPSKAARDLGWKPNCRSNS